MGDGKSQDERRIAAEADEWLWRFHTADATERAAFADWLLASPRHIDEFLLRTAFYKELSDSGLETSAPTRPHGRTRARVELGWANVVSLHPEPCAARRAVSWRRLVPLASAACALALVVGAVYILLPRSSHYSTSVGEHRIFALADGSSLHLNTRSRAEVRFSPLRREVRLLEGEALFSIAHERYRPFRVITDTAAVQAIGTRFSVYRRADRGTTVSVLEGRVRVLAAGSAPLQMDAGREVEVPATANQPIRVSTAAPNEFTHKFSWQEGYADFTGQTLATATAELNRYNTQQILIEDPEIAAEPVSGHFRVSDVDSFVAALKERFHLQAASSGPANSGSGVIRLLRAPPADTPPRSTTALPSRAAQASSREAIR